MRRKGHLIVGLVCGVLCVLGISSYAADLRTQLDEERADALARYGGEQVEILVATEDIAVGDMLDSTNCEKQLWLSALVPDGAVADMTEFALTPLTSPIFAGEVILEHRFDEGETVALQVPDGKCAVSVPAKTVSAVGGSMGPGSYVDVYSASNASTDLLASKVLVLSTSTTATDGEKGQSDDVTWIALAVDPSMVEELITASQKSELYFALPAEDVAGSLGVDERTDDAAAEHSEEEAGVSTTEATETSETSEASDEEALVSSSGRISIRASDGAASDVESETADATKLAEAGGEA